MKFSTEGSHQRQGPNNKEIRVSHLASLTTNSDEQKFLYVVIHWFQLLIKLFGRCEHLPWNHSLQSLDGRFCDAATIDGIYTETRKSIIPELLIAVEIVVKIKSPK